MDPVFARALVVALVASSPLVACNGNEERVTPREQGELPTTSEGSLIQALCFRGDSAIDREDGVAMVRAFHQTG